MAAASHEYEYFLTHEDGTEVTAQEVYDAYMSGKVMVRIPQESIEELSGFPTHYRSIGYISWLDHDGSQNNPNDVGLVMLALYAMDTPIFAGNRELIK